MAVKSRLKRPPLIKTDTILPGKPGAGTLAYVLRPDPFGWFALLSLWTAFLWAVALPAGITSKPEETGSGIHNRPGFDT